MECHVWVLSTADFESENGFPTQVGQERSVDVAQVS